MSHIYHISKGVVLNILMHFVVVFFFVSNDFRGGLTGFSVLIVISLSLTGFWIGLKGKRFSELDAILVGILTCSAFLLYISMYEKMDTMTNVCMMIIYALTSFITAFIGSLFRPKTTTKNIPRNN